MINKYKGFAGAKARTYFLIGADREDIIHEGMIGLYKAIRDFRGDKLSKLRAFAELCIARRQIVTAIKTATKQKHIPLDPYISLNKPISKITNVGKSPGHSQVYCYLFIISNLLDINKVILKLDAIVKIYFM